MRGRAPAPASLVELSYLFLPLVFLVIALLIFVCIWQVEEEDNLPRRYDQKKETAYPVGFVPDSKTTKRNKQRRGKKKQENTKKEPAAQPKALPPALAEGKKIHQTRECI